MIRTPETHGKLLNNSFRHPNSELGVVHLIFSKSCCWAMIGKRMAEHSKILPKLSTKTIEKNRRLQRFCLYEIAVLLLNVFGQFHGFFENMERPSFRYTVHPIKNVPKNFHFR